ncbi:gas vesicle protein GvpJ [Halorarum halobium]|uniref:gas vesicle protein GvpJ n=1 Tax=Halorarum halobium TaxID=3075121 RepID=UPI003CCD2599
MSETRPTRSRDGLAETLELVLDKGLVINADVVVSVGDTELLSVELRAALASFETAAEYGLRFPAGTDTDRVAAAADVPPVRDRPEGQTRLSDLEDLRIEDDPDAGVRSEGGDPDDGDEAADQEATDETDPDAEPEGVPEADDQD